MLKRMIDPDTGAHVLVTPKAADAFRARGYTDAGADPSPSRRSKKQTATGDQPEAKPLEKMKLAELLEHAGEAGVDQEALEALRKPGTSKAQVIEAIAAAAAAAE